MEGWAVTKGHLQRDVILAMKDRFNICGIIGNNSKEKEKKTQRGGDEQTN